VVNELLQKTAEQTGEEITKYCWKERNRPFTLNGEYMSWKEEQRTALAISRHGSPLSSDCPPHLKGSPHFELHDTANGQRKYFPSSEENLCTVLAAYGIKLSSLKQLSRIHRDEYDTELDVIAHVKSYFEVASKRIIDDIPMIFETSFAIAFARDLEKNLHEKLNLVGPNGLENCARYVRDEPEIQKKRKDWTRQLEILKKAETKLIKFHISN
jgi:hypothetical protein